MVDNAEPSGRGGELAVETGLGFSAQEHFNDARNAKVAFLVGIFVFDSVDAARKHREKEGRDMSQGSLNRNHRRCSRDCPLFRRPITDNSLTNVCKDLLNVPLIG